MSAVWAEMAVPAIGRVIEQRRAEQKCFGPGFDNPALEHRRILAIEWMRAHSKTGWVCDRPLVRVGA